MNIVFAIIISKKLYLLINYKFLNLKPAQNY